MNNSKAYKLKNLLLGLLKSGTVRVLISVIIIFIPMSIFSDKFLSISNLSTILRNQSIYGIMAIGVLMIILTGGIDLSVGSIYGLTGTICALCLLNGFSIPISIILTILSGAVLGLINGFFVARVKIAPFIATLGMLGIARGLNYILTGSKSVVVKNEDFIFIGKGYLGIVPVAVIIAVIIIIIFFIVLNNTIFGRRIYAIGGSEESAILAGINVGAINILIYTIAGSLYAVGGIIGAAKVASSYPLSGSGYEFEVIAACVIGGTLLSGGKGSIIGVILGAIFIGILKNSIVILGISHYWQQALNGFIIIVIIAISSFLSKSKE